VIGRRPNGLAHARQMRMRRSAALERQLATGQAQLRAEELLPGDVIRLAGNVWVVRDCRLGADGVCFLATLGGHMHACDRAQPVQLLSAQAGIRATVSRYSAEAANAPSGLSLRSL
jgi:hypothetical protein